MAAEKKVIGYQYSLAILEMCFLALSSGFEIP